MKTNISLYFQAVISFLAGACAQSLGFSVFLFLFAHSLLPFLLVGTVSALTSRKVNFFEEKCQWRGRSIFLPFSEHKFKGLLPVSLAEFFPSYSCRHALQELFLFVKSDDVISDARTMVPQIVLSAYLGVKRLTALLRLRMLIKLTLMR